MKKELCNQIKNLIDNAHPQHWKAMKLHCRTHQPYKFFEEIDFGNPSVRAFVESYIALKEGEKWTT